MAKRIKKKFEVIDATYNLNSDNIVKKLCKISRNNITKEKKVYCYYRDDYIIITSTPCRKPLRLLEKWKKEI